MKKKRNITSIQKPIVKMNSLFNDIIDNITHGSNKSDSSRQRELMKISSTVDDILGDEVDSLKTFTGDDIGTFLTKLMNEYDTNHITDSTTIEDVFEKEDMGLFELFKSRNSNKLLLYNDLESIHEYLFELQEAISTTRDSILTADDFTSTISRNLKFDNTSETDSTIDSYMKEIESLERRFKLPQKLKEHVVPNTLKYGTYYVYTIPYSKLFSDISRKKSNIIKEAVTLESFSSNYIKDMRNDISDNEGQIFNTTDIANSLSDLTENITVSNDDIAIPLLEHADVNYLDTVLTPKSINSKKVFSDGVIASENFDGVRDCYIEYIDPRKMFPVKIFKKTVGYYYLREEEKMINSKTTNIFSTTNMVSSDSMNADVERRLVGDISKKVLKSFNKKFLEENIHMKELIANALIFNDMYNKKIHFQFIPAEYITEFKINTNLDDEGVSILKPALFNAKLYLGLLVFKITSIVTKSNDTKITYVRNSGMDKNITRQIQNIARDIKSKQLNFKDLFSNSMMGKAGSAKDVYMPVGSSGERGMEFDILSGQQIDLHNEFMEKLRSSYITSTGVPSVMLNYVNEADYAKTLVMANIKYVSRVISYQLDISDSVTELYRKICKYCTDIPENMISLLMYKLTPPKSANMSNMVDLFNNTDQIATSIVKVITGENADQSDFDNKVKDYLYNKIMKDNLSMLEWSKFDEFIKQSKMEAAEFFADKKAKESENEGENEY